MDSNFSHNIKKNILLWNLRIWDPLIHLHTPRCHNTYGCVRLEPGASSGDLPHGPSFVAFPGHWQGADQKQNSQNINKCPCGMLASQVSSGFTHCTTTLTPDVAYILGCSAAVSRPGLFTALMLFIYSVASSSTILHHPLHWTSTSPDDVDSSVHTFAGKALS